jgi:hypothetical protein
MGGMECQNMQDTELTVNVAADDAAPTVEEEESLLEVELYHILGDLERARAWIALIEAHAELDAEEVRALHPGPPHTHPIR